MKWPLATLEAMLADSKDRRWIRYTHWIESRARPQLLAILYPDEDAVEDCIARAFDATVLAKAVRAHGGIARDSAEPCDHRDCAKEILNYVLFAARNIAIDRLRYDKRRPSNGFDFGIFEAVRTEGEEVDALEHELTQADEGALLAFPRPLGLRARRWCEVHSAERGLELAEIARGLLMRGGVVEGESDWMFRWYVLEHCLLSAGETLWTPYFHGRVKQRHLAVLVLGCSLVEVAARHGCSKREVKRSLVQAAKAGKLAGFPLEAIVRQALVTFRAWL